MNPPARPTCPACGTPLRLRLPPAGDLSWDAHCPDCKAPLTIHREAEAIRIRNAQEKPPQDPQPQPRHRLHKPLPSGSLPDIKSWLGKSWRSPLALAWASALIILLLSFVAVRDFLSSPTRSPSPISSQLAEAPPQPVDPNPVQPPHPPNDADDPSSAIPPAPTARVPANVPPLPSPTAVDPPPAPPVIAAQPDFTPQERATRALMIQLLEYQQTSPVPFETIRMELEELIGVPIRYSEGIEPTQEMIQVDLANVSIGEVLQEITQQVDLQFEIDNHGILLK